MLNEDEKKQIVATIKYGFILDLLKLMISFSIRNNKTDINDQLKVVAENFYTSLDEEEKQNYQNEAAYLVKEKVEEIRLELSKKYNQEQVEEVIELIKGIDLLEGTM